MATPETSKKRLALAIIDFLNNSLKDGTVSSEDSESIEIATNCIAESFKVDPSDQAAVKDAIGGQNLLAIYSVYEKLKGKNTTSTAGSSSTPGAGAAAPQTGAKDTKGTEADSKKKADELKGKGNQAMAAKNYDEAIDYYTQALNIVPLEPIYLSNRAAAYSAAHRHEEAKGDAEMAVAADPNYAKGWSRLGFAAWATGDAKGSMEAYKNGLDVPGLTDSMRTTMRKGYETAKQKVEDEEGPDAADEIDAHADRNAAPGGLPDLSSLAGLMGGGGGGGGMPDFSQMMNNPMMRQMAQNIMSNPDALNNLMSNPRIREMASQFGGGGGGAPGGGGGGMPNLSEMMNDPSIAEMARNFMGGAGGAGAGRGRGQ